MNDITATTTRSSLEHGECILQSVTSILNSTCGVAVQPRDNPPEVTPGGVMIGIISLVGDLEWSVFFGLAQETAVSLAAKFAGFDIPFDSPDMGDAIGELTNILGGDVKARLDAKGVHVDISLPTVIRADNIHVLIQKNASIEKVCFDSPVGSLWAGVSVAGKGPRFIG